MANIEHVTDYNMRMVAAKKWIMVFTIGNGSMQDRPRKRGWVVYGDNYVKWLPNYEEALAEQSVRA